MSVKLKYLCLAHRKHPDQAHLGMTAGRKKLTPPLQRLIRTRKLVWLYSLPFYYERGLNSNSGKMVLWHECPTFSVHRLSESSSCSLPQPLISRFTGLSCGKQYKPGLCNNRAGEIKDPSVENLFTPKISMLLPADPPSSQGSRDPNQCGW